MIVMTLTILLMAVVVGMQVVQGDGTPSGTHTRSGGRHGQFVLVVVVVGTGIHRIRRRRHHGVSIRRFGEPCIGHIPDLRTVSMLATTTSITGITGIRFLEIDE